MAIFTALCLQDLQIHLLSNHNATDTGGNRVVVTRWLYLPRTLTSHKPSTSLLLEVQENLEKFTRHHGMRPL